jgi:hypothetical protein
MQTQPRIEFMSWAIDQGIVTSPRYPNSGDLEFKGEPIHARFWVVPTKPDARAAFIRVLLQLLGEWQRCFVWVKKHIWPKPTWREDPSSQVELTIFRDMGIPLGTDDVVQLCREEIGRLVALVFVRMLFFGTSFTDLNIVPDNAQYIMMTDHHGVVHVRFKRPETVDDFIAAMDKAGFPLPDELPDGTFKMPDWMRSAGPPSS